MSRDQAREPKLTGFEGFLRRIARSDSVFGSDIYVNYTHDYVWQANQFGHVCVGLLVGLALIWLLGGSVFGFLLVIGLYAFKEFLDYEIAVRLQEGVFPVNKREALSDGVADWGFVTLGAVVALFVMARAPALWACDGWACTGLTAFWLRWADLFDYWGIAAALAAPVLDFFILRRIYLPPKRAHDKSGLPLFVRLPTFPNNFGLEGAQLRDLAKTVFTFAIAGAKPHGRSTCKTRQIVISGPDGSGRTTLALSIGGEATNRCAKVRYLSAERLAEKAAAGFEIQSDVKQPYQVAEAHLVIVDDVSAKDVPSTSPDGARRGIERLVGIQNPGDLTIFRRPLQEREQTATRTRPPPPDPKPRDRDPAIVWVLCDETGLDTVVEAIRQVFGLAADEIYAINLKAELDDVRVKTAAM